MTAASPSKACIVCDVEFEKHELEGIEQWQRRKHCSPRCRYRTVERVIAGETKIHSEGYRMVFVPMHPSAKRGYVYEHRLVMERQLGRLLASHEYVHHRNDDRLDNRPENLEVVDGSTHQIGHHSGIYDELIANCLRRGWTHR